jgi:hypothetical protein
MLKQTYGLLVSTMNQHLMSDPPRTERARRSASLWTALAAQVAVAGASLFLAVTLTGAVVAGLTDSGVIGVA